MKADHTHSRRRHGSRFAAGVALATLAATVAVSLAGVRPAAADATYTVTTAADGGPGSLRDAVTQANGATGTVSIQLLDGADHVLTDCSAELAVSGPTDLTIRAATGATITQTCPGKRVLNLAASNSVTLQNVTLTGGNLGDSQQGGGVRADASVLTLRDSTVSGNSAGASSQGGGVYASSVVLEGTTRVTGNSLGDGGIGAGVYADFAVVVDHPSSAPGLVSVDRNTINGHGTGAGVAAGGVYASSGLGFDSSPGFAVVGNRITSYGTGAGLVTFEPMGTVTLADTWILDNRIEGTGTSIGAGAAFEGAVSLTRVLVARNAIPAGTSSVRGGGLYIGGGGTISRSTFQGNDAGPNSTGGAIYSVQFGLAISDTTVTGNHAATGGGLRLVPSSQLAHTSLVNNTATTAAELSTTSGALTSVHQTLVAHTVDAVAACNRVFPADTVQSAATDTSCGTTGVTIITDPALGPLQSMDSTPVASPLTASPLFDACGTGCDIGASNRVVGRTSWGATDVDLSVAAGATVAVPVPNGYPSGGDPAAVSFVPVDLAGGHLTWATDHWTFTAGTTSATLQVPFYVPTGHLGIVTIHVGGTGVPVASPIDTFVSLDQPTDVALSATDPDGGGLTYQLDPSVWPAEGSVSIAGATATYTPPPGGSTMDTVLFRYRATDADGNWSAAVATLHPAAPTISGTAVDDVTSSPLQGIRVRLYTPAEVLVDTTYTAADGSWSFTGLASGNFVVQFADKANHAYELEYWHDARNPATATPVPTGTTGLVAELDPVPTPAAISGTALDATTSSPLQGIRVRAYTPALVLAGDTYTASDGTWSLADLPSGSYLVQFADKANHAYELEYWHDARNPATATPVPTGTTGLVAELDPVPTPAAISGTALDATTSSPLQGIRVRAYTPALVLAGDTYTAADGTWSFADLPSGSYLIQFADKDGHAYWVEYWQDATNFASATPVPTGTTGLVAYLDPVASP